MKLTDHVLQCGNPDCKKVFTVYSENLAILEVHLEGAEKRNYEYCSKKHLESMLENLNKNTPPFELRVYIDRKEIVSERNPFKMVVYLKVEELKVESLTLNS